MEFIAEVGSNWWHPEPDKARLLALGAIRDARWAGATIIKFQMLRARELYAATRTGLSVEDNERLAKLRNDYTKYELAPELLLELVKTAHAQHMRLWCSFFSVALLERYGKEVDGIKVASGDLDNYDLTDAAGRIADAYGKQVCFSTGAGTWDEIKAAARVIGTQKRFIVLHCVSAYPAPMESMNLLTLRDLATLPKLQAVGLSDHTMGNLAGQIAVGMGATYFEKHFRPDHALDTNPDYAVSLERFQLRSYIGALQSADQICGKGKRDPDYEITPEEKMERVWARRGEDNLRPRI